MRCWTVRAHLAGLVALAAAACARGERAPAAAGVGVTDDAGRRVTLAAPARRVVSLLPSFTEILFAIGAGDRLVGRTAWCDYPPAALAVPSVGDGMPPNVEAVAARPPDLVVVDRSGAARPRCADRPEWRVVPAVRERRFLLLPGRLFGRPSPRAAEAVRELRRRLETTP